MLINKSKKRVYIIFSKSNLKIYSFEKKLKFKIYLNKLDYKKVYKKIKSYLKNKNIVVCFGETTYIKEEVFQYDIFKIEDYIQEFCVENLKKEKEDLFIKTYKLKEKYIFYIFDRDFIEEIIEIFIKNQIIVEGIYIDINLENKINDYDLILGQIKKINYNLLFMILCMIVLFASMKIFENRLRKSILIIKQESNVLKQRNYEIKEEINKESCSEKNIKKEVERKTIKNNIKRNFFIILSYLNENINITKYKIKNFKIQIEGKVCNKNELFNFMEKLESDKYVKVLKYDYIEKKHDFYIFSLEIEVI